MNIGVFQRFKDSLLKITTTSSESAGRDSQNYLNMMNLPAMMAKRDAAYDRAAQIMRGEIFSLPEEKRFATYEAAGELLNIAIEATTQTMSGKEDKNSENDGTLKYLFLLNERIRLVKNIVKHEQALFEEENSLGALFGPETRTHLRVTDTLFSNMEMEIYHSIVDFIANAEPTIKKYRNYIKKSISKNNLNRYSKSFNEHMAMYMTVGATDDPP